MSKQFAMLDASRRLENYLSRERYNLQRMESNPSVSDSLLMSKVDHYNQLVGTLNDLFGSLIDTKEQLFVRYVVEGMDDDSPAMTVELPSYRSEGEHKHVVDDTTRYSGVETVEDRNVDVSDDDYRVEDTPKPVVTREAEHRGVESTEEIEAPSRPQWERDGYLSEEDWLLDKEAESAEQQDDLTVSVNPSLSRYRAEKVLSEYTETAEQDISTYNPEDDVPISVLPSDVDKDEDTEARPTENLDYLNHTVEKVRVDNDPTQIVNVRTAVELGGEEARRGVDIDINDFAYKSDRLKVEDILGDEISKYRVNQDEASDEDEDTESVDEDVYEDTDGVDYEDIESADEEDEHYHEADEDLPSFADDDIRHESVHDEAYDEEEEHEIHMDDDEGSIIEGDPSDDRDG